MEIYIALRNRVERDRSSVIVGAFSTQDEARAACQAVEDGSPDTKPDGTQLVWWDTGYYADTRADADDGDSYQIILANLDEPL